MLTPLALFLGLLAATAFIAHWSDNLGKKLGKKRVSVFGLRPRTSATLLTVVSSWGIMALTLVALLLAVAPLRIALFSYEQQLTSFEGKIKASQQRLQQVEFQRKAAQTQAQGLQSLVEKKQSDATRASLAATKAREDATKAQQDSAKAKADLNRATTALNRAQSAEQTAKRGESSARAATNAAQKQEQQARAAFASANLRLSGTQARLQQIQSALGQTQSDLATKQSQVVAVQQRLTNFRQRLQKSQRQLANSQKELVASQRQLVGASKQLFNTGKELVSSFNEVSKAQAKVKHLNITAQELQNSVTDLSKLYADKVELATGLAFNDIRLHFDQTFAERRIDANPSPEQIKNELRVLVASSQDAAHQLVPDAKVAVEPLYTPDAKTGERVALSEEQTLDSYARLLAASNQSVSARLVSASNYPEGQKRVLARFVFVPVRTIYTAQQTIGESTIDATKSEAAIFGQLQDLVEEARLNAVKSGSNPPLSPEDRNFFDGDTGQKMFDTLRQLQRLGRPVPVRVVAARDLDATEPLQIRFQIGAPNAARNTT